MNTSGTRIEHTPNTPKRKQRMVFQNAPPGMITSASSSAPTAHRMIALVCGFSPCLTGSFPVLREDRFVLLLALLFDVDFLFLELALPLVFLAAK